MPDDEIFRAAATWSTSLEGEDGALVVRSFARTDVGRRKPSNEDAFLRDDSHGLYIVADGMGGHAAGDVASAEAVDAASGMVRRGLVKLGSADEPLTENTARAACRLVESAIQAATYMVFGIAEQDPNKSGMGTTMTLLLRHGRALVTGQVGDSRIYRIRAGGAEQLTEDHTLIAWQVKRGLITEEQARVSPQRNIITRAVGSRDYVEVDVQLLPIERGDTFLICSDGLHGYFEAPELAAIVHDDLATAADVLIDEANARGGRDNITVVLVRFD